MALKHLLITTLPLNYSYGLYKRSQSFKRISTSNLPKTLPCLQFSQYVNLHMLTCSNLYFKFWSRYLKISAVSEHKKFSYVRIQRRIISLL